MQSGAVVRVTGSTQPRWHFKLPFEFLRTQATYLEFQQLMSFFLSQLGQYGEFLFDDPRDDTATDSLLAAFPGADGGNQFQLARDLKDSAGNLIAQERIFAPMLNTIVLKVNGVPVSSSLYTIGPTWLVTFAVAPTYTGFPMTWSGNFWFRCRFLQDETDFDKLWNNMWSAKLLEFISVKD